MPTAASTSARARKSLRSILPVSQQVAHGDLHQFHDLIRLDFRLRGEALAGAWIMSMLTLVTGRKLPRSTRIGRLRSTSEGCSTSPDGSEHRGAAQAELHQLQAHHAVVDVAELDAGELDHVDFDAIGGEVVEQRFEHQLRLVVQEKGGVEQIDSDDAQRLLLQTVFADPACARG